MALVCLAALLGVVAGSASAANWALRRIPPKVLEEGYEDSAALGSISCVGESLCVAVGALDTVAFSQDPNGGAEKWHVVYPTFTQREAGRAFDSISCVTTTLCVVVGKEGFVYSSTDPTGGADAWSATDLADHGTPHLQSVSCPSTSLCVAVSGERGPGIGRVVTSTDPTSGQWQTTALPGEPDLRGVSCATTTLCVAVGAAGKVFVSIDPTGGASSWRAVGSPTQRELRAISCVTGLCLAGDEGGNLVTSTDPGGTPFAAVNGGGSVLLTDASCPTASSCVAVDDNADVVTSTDPTGGAGAWSFQNLVPFEAEPVDTGQFVGNALWGVSCGTPSFCVLVGAEGRIFTSTAPFAVTKSSATGGGGGAGAGAARKKSLRPRTHLFYAKGFWKGAVAHHGHAKAKFRFYSREGARGFVCRRDGGGWGRCHSPLSYWATPGAHVLRVRAIGRTGLRGPVAAITFRIYRPHHRHR